MDHPFHIHTNSFQLPDNEDLPAAAWHDVVNVPSGSRRRIRIPFADFDGLTVYHCHILDHEDLGMMGTLRMAS
jgi:FtsP/CotA-like multicopper oxidase with cupredoxin domain